MKDNCTSCEHLESVIWCMLTNQKLTFEQTATLQGILEDYNGTAPQEK